MKYILLGIIFGILAFFTSYIALGQIEEQRVPFSLVFQSGEISEDAIKEFMNISNQQTAIYTDNFNQNVQGIRKNLIIFTVIGASLGFIIALMIPEQKKEKKEAKKQTKPKHREKRKEIVDSGVIEAEVVSRVEDIEPEEHPGDELMVEVNVEEQRESKRKKESKKEAIQSWFDTYDHKENIRQETKEESPETPTEKPEPPKPVHKSSALNQWLSEEDGSAQDEDDEPNIEPEKIKRKRAINAWLGKESAPPEKAEEEKVVLEREPEVLPPKDEPELDESPDPKPYVEEDNSDFYKIINPFGMHSLDDEDENQ